MRKYLIYAFGEILLVVIGILIALQINNWNEGRKNQQTIRTQYLELKNSLSSDFEKLSSQDSRLKEVELSGLYLWSFLNEEIQKIDSTKLKTAFLTAGNGFTFSPNRLIYDELIYNGHISLIKSKKLKEMLANYYNENKTSIEIEDQRRRYSKAYTDGRFNHMSPMMLKKRLNKLFRSEKRNATSIMPNLEDNFTINWGKVKEDKVFKNNLGKVLAVAEIQFNEINEKKKLISNIERLIEGELKK